MKLLIGFLICLLVVLQSKLWLEHDGILETFQLKKEVAMQEQENQKLVATNQALIAEVNDLKHGHVAIEERARSELGMIKEGEKFYQIMGN